MCLCSLDYILRRSLSDGLDRGLDWTQWQMQVRLEFGWSGNIFVFFNAVLVGVTAPQKRVAILSNPNIKLGL